jgi:hypothetical protein
MIAGWKIRRELERLGQQVRGLTDRFTDPIAQRSLDRAVAAGLPSMNGAMAIGRKVALYLVYQPKGLEASTLATCRRLSQAGYTPLIVSNAPISSDNKTRLAPVVWRAIERPNFGYDFGGYRDGLIYPRHCDVAPDELLILNDSIWFGITPEADPFTRLDAQPANIAGTILRQSGTVQFLESYLYRLRRPVLEHPPFTAYWENLRLTSNKYHVIRRGERGFSAAMQAAGVQVAGVYDSAGLPEFIAHQDDDFLRLTLQYGAYIDIDLAADSARLLHANGPTWREDVLAHVHTVLTKRQGYSSFPYANMRLHDYPLLKKSGEPCSLAWRLAYLNAVHAHDLPLPPPELLDEINARDTGRKSAT